MQTRDQAVDAIWQAMGRGQFMPVEWRHRLSIDDAYRVQLAIMQRKIAAGDRQVGWKVGLTSAAMRRQQGIDAPCFGFLLASGRWPSGASPEHAALISPGIENELCVRVKRRLAGPDVDHEEAAAAIEAVMPAFEIAEVRGDFAADLALSIADNVQQRGFVLGAEVHDPRALSAIRTSTVIVSRNGEQCETADATAVMEDPVNSLVWLANVLHRYDAAIEPGMLVMTGSFTRQYAARRGDRFEARFDPFGEVAVQFG
ncbi:2-oxo-hepta-3-ene-1,7-dioic acid hydratase [soil metagenome]